MNLLLDTHVLLWSLADDAKLGAAARAAIVDPDNTVYVSAVSAWEIAIKAALGRVDMPRHAGRWLPDALRRTSFVELGVTVKHALGVEELPPHHADPFDRLLVAQARAEELTLVTADPLVARYDVPTLRT